MLTVEAGSLLYIGFCFTLSGILKMSHTFVFYNTPDCMDSSAIETAFDLASTSAQMDSIYQIPTELLMLPQYCQPYLDHSYAKLPTSSSNSVDLQQLPVSIDPSTDQLGAFIDIEDISCNTTVVTAPTERGANDEPSEGAADPWEGSVTRCVCDFQHDDGYMICCDRCGVWQHVDCMGVDRNNIPESYLCELCMPRLVDKRRAIRLQTIKKEQMESDMSASDSSSDEIFGRRGSGRKKPGRKRMDGRSNAAQKRPVKRKTSEPDEERLTDKRNRPAATSGKVTGPRGPRRQSAGESSFRARHNSAYEADQHVTIDHSVEDICQNSYTVGVRSLLAAVKDNEMATVKLNATTPTNPSLLKEQISKQRIRLVEFGPNVKGVVANETIRINQAVAEYTGRVMMVEEFDRSNRSESVAVPFVLRYAGPQGMSICIDASVSGNDVKYIRCSCMPNAKVVHVVEKNALRFFVCATKNIAEGREVTIPFHFDYQKSDLEVFCACGRASCQVARFFKQKSSSRPVRVRRSAALPELEDKPRLAATNVLDNGRASATPSGARQNNRRSALASDMSKIVNPDVGADITLMNALAAISTATYNGAPGSSPQLTICSADAQFNGGHSLLDASEGPGDKHGETSSATKMKEATKGEKGKKQHGGGSSGRSKGQQTPGTRPETETDRVGPVRSNRLRDKAQQLAAISSQKD